MAKRVPTCKKCNRQHYNMLPCPVDPTEDQPPVQWKGSMEGFKTFGNQARAGSAFLGDSANTIRTGR